MVKEYDRGKVQWNLFLREWGDALENARHIVHILGKETESLASLELGEFVEPDNVAVAHGGQGGDGPPHALRDAAEPLGKGFLQALVGPS